jgi:TRAP-type C4-dicarboxylate transport system substrate-binding protein
MKKRIVVVVLVAILLVSLSGLLAAHAQEGQAAIKLKYSVFQPVTIYSTPLQGKFCEEIKKRTNGRVEITYYPGGTLVTATKIYDGIVNRVTDIGSSHTAYTRGRFPVTEMLDLPVGYTSGFVSTHVKYDFYKKFKPKEWNDVHVLYLWSDGPQIFATAKKPFKSMEDLKGLKFRGLGRPADTIKALGAVPVALETADTYDAVQRGLLDGLFEAADLWKGFRFGDVVKYAGFTQRATGLVYTFYVAMNKDKWNALPDDIKKIFDEAAEEWVDRMAVGSLEAELDGINYFKQQGGKVISLPEEEIKKMQNAVEPVIDNYMKEMEKKGYKKADLDEQLKFIRERVAYWNRQEKDRKLKDPYVQ